MHSSLARSQRTDIGFRLTISAFPFSIRFWNGNGSLLQRLFKSACGSLDIGSSDLLYHWSQSLHVLVNGSLWLELYSVEFGYGFISWSAYRRVIALNSLAQLTEKVALSRGYTLNLTYDPRVSFLYIMWISLYQFLFLGYIPLAISWCILRNALRRAHVLWSLEVRWYDISGFHPGHTLEHVTGVSVFCKKV